MSEDIIIKLTKRKIWTNACIGFDWSLPEEEWNRIENEAIERIHTKEYDFNFTKFVNSLRKRLHEYEYKVGKTTETKKKEEYMTRVDELVQVLFVDIEEEEK